MFSTFSGGHQFVFAREWHGCLGGHAAAIAKETSLRVWKIVKSAAKECATRFVLFVNVSLLSSYFSHPLNRFVLYILIINYVRFYCYFKYYS